MQSMILRSSFLCASVLVVGACIGSPNEPASCEPMPWTVASTSGDTTITSTGLRFIEGQEGAGLELDWCGVVAIHYEAFLLDGTRFDSSREFGRALVFAPGFEALIDGIEQGVIGMRTGGTRRLIIPPDLGYGPEPRVNTAGEVIVPGNSTVIYDIEVLEIG